MTLTASALTTVATVEDELGITAGSETARLERYIGAASDAIRAYLNRPSVHYQAAVSERLAGLGRQRLVLSVAPLLSITSVVIDGTTIDSSEYEIDDADAGLLYARYGFRFTGLLRPDIVQADNWPGTEQKLITVTYAGGWVTPQQVVLDNALTRTLPYDLEAAAWECVAYLYRRRGDDRNVKSESLGDASVTYIDVPRVLAPGTLELLNPYRWFPVAV